MMFKSGFLLALIHFLTLEVDSHPVGPSGVGGAVWWRQCKLLDMTYELNDKIVGYPIKDIADNSFKFDTLANKTVDSESGGYYLYYGKYCSVEHFGTHMDAPNHILKTAEEVKDVDAVHQVALSSLIGEACVIDVPEKEKFKGSKYQVTVEEVQQWEEANGQLNENCIVIVRTGQEKFWGDRKGYLGTETPDHTDESGWPDTLAWPGLSPEAAQWMLDNRNFKALGVDTISLDAGGVRDFRHSVHTVVLGSNRPGFENLAQVSKLPARGATLIGLPLPITGGSGSPIRVFAYGWDGPEDPCRLASDDA